MIHLALEVGAFLFLAWVAATAVGALLYLLTLIPRAVWRALCALAVLVTLILFASYRQ